MISSAKNHSHLLLTLVFFIVSFSLLEPVMSWILILVICATVMRTALYLELHKHAPSIRTLNLLALLSAIVLAYFSWQLGILLGMLNLLVLACSLKLMLLRSDKDYFQLITSCGFLIGCGFIFQQGIAFSLFYFALTLVLLMSLATHISPNLPLNKLIKKVSVMGAQAIPITLLLFMVLPLIGPLWQMPASKSHQTGLAEKVTPGDIANLSQSAELAFRVTFDGTIPAPQERYWRALVMENFDGESWQVSPDRKAIQRQYKGANREFSPILEGNYYQYQVIAEPTHQSWLYALDVATPIGASSQQKVWQSHEYQLSSISPLVSTFQYEIRSFPQVLLNQTLSSVDKRINRQLPEQGNPLTKQWVAETRQKYTTDDDFIAAVMFYFSSQDFEYTLQPPLMPNDQVDTFLFVEQRGFCSHYASAMAYMLRLGGIPARLVTGYQGGEQLDSDYMSVYQYDAHAWIEAWHDDRGWIRYDPTAIVAPNRLESGLRNALNEADLLLGSGFGQLSTVAWLNSLRNWLKDVDFFWTKWVLGFDKDKQQDLIKSLIGKITPQKLAMFSLGAVLLIFALIALFFLPIWRKPKQDKASYYYELAEHLLTKVNLHRRASQGPADFVSQVKNKAPSSITEPFAAITDLYIQHHYQPSSISQQQLIISRMKSHWKQLKQAMKKQKG
ncbi:DUF3488 and transglutaminase-like domain-containing protein [Aliiglaciecola sp. M165]|uniref:transglutaminase family protein n=1 Tax=Aliiglaciecola sp. M165 TaxID=2593649 RepID=UPI00117BFB3F|nr:DUF3488 and transglutaminase-like domain-containing protein [Aliiglaciecola sp. M165]TRY29329.1 DUF3488 domain-containing protein [Aliiglaciecola sp. M165]